MTTRSTAPKRTRKVAAAPAHIAGLTRAVCPGCGAATVAGRVVLRAVTVDPAPLSPLGEALVLLAGGRTWTAWAHGLALRGAAEIMHLPAGGTSAAAHSGAYDVVADHRCNAVVVPAAYSASRIPEEGSAEYGRPPF